MRFISYIYVSAALLWAAYANPLPNEPTTNDVSARSVDVITELDLVAARAQLDAEDSKGPECSAGEDPTAAGVPP
ncbi:hypothetical protein C8R45DRAFT_1115448 [Mycena sanguinolenta]|nr:hypothetical protein C8R45DRAFT_1115448 [Mycena sanguinolenta]